MRVSELAKELGKTSKDVLDVLQKNNQDVASHSSNVNEAQIGMVKKALNAGASEQPKADGAAPKKKLAAVYRPQNSQQRPAQPKPAARPQAQNTSAPAQQAAENAAPQQVKPRAGLKNCPGTKILIFRSTFQILRVQKIRSRLLIIRFHRCRSIKALWKWILLRWMMQIP